MFRHVLLLIPLLAVSIAGSSSTATAWEPFRLPLTLSERGTESSTVVFGEFLNSVEPTTKGGVRDGRFRILHVAKSSEAIEKGKIVVAAVGGNWKVGEHAMLTLYKKQFEDFWDASPAISRACYDYALAAPPSDLDAGKRVPYFLRHLNSSDRQISDDAFVELERAPMHAIVASAKFISREFVAVRLQDDSTDELHVGLYGRMLGLAGNVSDRKLLRGLIENAVREEDSFPFGFDGITSGYLLLAGENGLDWIDENLLKEMSPETPFWRTYAAMQAIRFVWRYGEGRISRPRLRDSMRLLLDDPRLADLAISQLAWWDDWSLHDRLLTMMDNPEFDEIWFKRAIIRYMVSSMLVPPEVQAHDPEGFRKAERFIRELRDTWPRPKWTAREGNVLIPGRHTIVELYETVIDQERQIPLSPFRQVLANFAAVFVLPKDPEAKVDDPMIDLKTQERKKQIFKRLADLDALVFKSKGVVIEVNANRTKITDDDLKGVGEFPGMTDLSLEETAITDKGLAHLTKLDGLVWLNLYRTKIGDEGLRHVAKLKRLELLPIGETKVTDKGLAHLKTMTQLTYLGLRGNLITDKGVARLEGLTKLTSLYLGGTKVTDAGLRPLTKMPKLEKLWLNDTAVSDKAIPLLAGLKSLRELHVENSKLTAAGVADLRMRMPACEILDGRE